MKGLFAQKYGPWALVTGAAMGLGKEFSIQIASRGLNCLLVDKNKKELERTASAIRRDFSVSVDAVNVDLSAENFLKDIRKKSDKLDIGLIVNNAGLTPVGRLLDFDEKYLLDQLHTNTRAPLVLTRHFVPRMGKKKRGGIIFISSGSANCGTAYSANYAGTKAWNLIFAESLWQELKPLGIDCLGFMPGPTESPGWYANDPDPEKLKPMPVSKCVFYALESLGKSPSASPGFFNRFGTKFMRTAPRAFVIGVVGKAMEKTFWKRLGLKNR